MKELQSAGAREEQGSESRLLGPLASPTSKELCSRLTGASVREAAASLKADSLPALNVLCVELGDMLKPATDEEILASVTRLFVHYPQSPTSPEFSTLRWSDWYADFEDMPVDCLNAACDQWRRSEERFAPTPGQLLAHARPLRNYRRALLRRVRDVIAKIG